jgi:hypothetical protein
MTDAAHLNRTTDLAALLPHLRRRGRYFVGPCPFCGGTDRFTVKRTDDGDLWHCRRCGPERYQDAVAFLMRRTGRPFAKLLAGEDRPAGGSGAPRAGRRGQSRRGDEDMMRQSDDPRAPHDDPRTPHDDPDAPPDEAWQIATLTALKPCLDALHTTHTPDARAIWDYLQTSRGLTRDTIWRASLGYNAEWREVLPGHWLAPGIVIPCMVDGVLWYVKVRTTRAARAESSRKSRGLGKYVALKGSATRALYNADALLRRPSAVDLTGRRTSSPEDLSGPEAVIVEGEFDALLLGQCLPPGSAAVTMGSAGSVPGPRFKPYLLGLDRVRLKLDDDAAGAAGMAAWERLLPRVERLPPLPGGAKDLTDFWRAGGDLAAWLSS